MSEPDGIADLRPVAASMRKQQKAWNWYDWANSAFYTTVLSVMFAPYMITVAKRAAGCPSGEAGAGCTNAVNLLGLNITAGSLPSYLTTFATLTSALLLPIVGALVDRSPRKKWHMGGYAFAGAASASLMFFIKDDQWQIGAISVVLSSILAGCSLVSYYAILVDISTEEERDQVSARGWAWGYLGGGILLALNLVLFLKHDSFGLEEAMAVRLSLLSAAIWWAVFTIIPLVRLRNYAPKEIDHGSGGLIQRSFGQLLDTLKDMRNYPVTLTFLLAYVFYNDGIQTVVASASTYGAEELRIESSVLIATILVIQFVAFGGALFFGRMAARYGAHKCILLGTVAWMLIVVWAFFLPRNGVLLFIITGILIGIVMGGTQALSRSFFSLLIPRGKEGEYFALYSAAERGTSWFGTLLFGLMFDFTGSYRPSIIALIIFFVLGAFFLIRVDPAKGIRDAGNRVPANLLVPN